MCFSHIEQLLGRTETRTRETMYAFYQSIPSNSLRHLPRRSCNNFGLQFVNSDIFKDNYSIDWSRVFFFCIGVDVLLCLMFVDTI